jgi:molecular chaperone HscB
LFCLFNISRVKTDDTAKVDETIALLKEAFSSDPPDLVEAKSLAVQLKYWQGLENAAKEWSPQ